MTPKVKRWSTNCDDDNNASDHYSSNSSFVGQCSCDINTACKKVEIRILKFGSISFCYSSRFVYHTDQCFLQRFYFTQWKPLHASGNFWSHNTISITTLARQKALTSEPQNKMQFLNKIHFLSPSSLSCAVLWQFQTLFNNFNCQLSNNVTPHFKMSVYYLHLFPEQQTRQIYPHHSL